MKDIKIAKVEPSDSEGYPVAQPTAGGEVVAEMVEGPGSHRPSVIRWLAPLPAPGTKLYTAPVVAGEAVRDRLWDAIVGELNLAYAQGADGTPSNSMAAADRIRALAALPAPSAESGISRRSAQLILAEVLEEHDDSLSTGAFDAIVDRISTPPAAPGGA
jgi:hypothetical protein